MYKLYQNSNSVRESLSFIFNRIKCAKNNIGYSHIKYYYQNAASVNE